MKGLVSIPEEDAGREAGAKRTGVSRRALLTFAAGAVGNTFFPKAATNERPPEGVLSAEEVAATIERVTGMPFSEFSKRFDGRVRIASPRGGTYILRIHQMHQPAQDAGRKISGQSEVVAAQRTTEKLLEAVIRANKLDGIFAEGFAEKDAAQRYRDAVRSLEGQLAELEKRSIGTTADAEKAYAGFERVYTASLNNPIFFHYTMRDIRALAHTLRNRFAALVPKSAEERAWLATFDLKLGAYGAERADLEIPDPYTEGADLKLFMDGKLKHIYPMEDRAANARAIKQAQGYRQARKDLGAGRIRREELEPYWREYREAAFTQRERIAFEKVGEWDRERARAGKRPENIVLFFGGDQDFTDTVRQQNKTAGHTERGLIELWAKRPLP